MAVESPFAWKVVAAAFVVATLSWGLSLYGLIAFIKVIPDLRGWPTAVVSGAVTVHFLFAALAVAFLTALH
ncbi:MAG: MFS transporter, partial [Hyphomicrobiaceae bacterium]